MNKNDIASMIEWLAGGIELSIKQLEEYPDNIEMFKKLIMLDVEKIKEYASMLKTE